MLRITQRSNNPIPQRRHFPQYPDFEGQNTAGSKERLHFSQGAHGVGEMAQKVAVIDNVKILPGNIQILQAGTNHLDAQTFHNAPRAIGMRLDPCNFKP
jgi:hypothetical protein